MILYRWRVGKGFRGHALSSRALCKAYPIFEKMQIDLQLRPCTCEICPPTYLHDTHTHTRARVVATMFPLTRGSGCIQSRLKCRFLIAWKPVCTAHRGRHISCCMPRYIAVALLHPSQLPHRYTFMLYAYIRLLLFHGVRRWEYNRNDSQNGMTLVDIIDMQ